MTESKKVDLPSGAKLEIQVSDFDTSRQLEMAITEEIQLLKIDRTAQVEDILKNVFCLGVSSKRIDAALWECMKRCTYNGIKIDKSTFEPVSAREDFHVVQFEVASENIRPFMKSLYARLKGEFMKLSTFLQ